MWCRAFNIAGRAREICQANVRTLQNRPAAAAAAATASPASWFRPRSSPPPVTPDDTKKVGTQLIHSTDLCVCQSCLYVRPSVRLSDAALFVQGCSVHALSAGLVSHLTYLLLLATQPRLPQVASCIDSIWLVLLTRKQLEVLTCCFRLLSFSSCITSPCGLLCS